MTRPWTWWLATLLGGLSGLLFLCTLPLTLLNRHAPDLWHINDSPFQGVAGVAYSLVGALLATRRPRNALGWLFLVLGFLWQSAALTGQWAVYGLETRPGAPGAALALWVSFWLASAAFGPTFPLLLFPSGRLADRRTRLVAIANGAATVGLLLALMSASFVTPGFPDIYARTPNPLAWRAEPIYDPGFGILGLGLCGLLSAGLLLGRFRRAQGVLREQYQWVVLAMVGFAATFVVDFIARLLGSQLSFIPGPALSLATAVMPVVMGIAILRYHLFDIDRVFNRALVYTALTATLGLLYLGLVLLFQSALRPVTSESNLEVALSTLIVAAVFQPVRRRIQRGVDRRFNRARYDASQMIATFSARLRNEIDLDTIGNDLQAIVAQTMQPAHLSLWLRPSSEPRFPGSSERISNLSQ
jgi:hypothetical protein